MPSIRRSLTALALATLIAAPLALRAADKSAKQAKLVVPITTHDGQSELAPNRPTGRLRGQNQPNGDQGAHEPSGEDS